MADRVKLRSPYGSAVVSMTADLAERYKAEGWLEADKPKRQAKAKANADAKDKTDK